MAVPDYQVLMAPCLHALSNGEVISNRDLEDRVAEQIGLTPKDRTETIPNSTKLRFPDRTSWAITYMAKAGAVTRPRRAYAQITERGLMLLKHHPDRVDFNILLQFPEFAAFRKLEPTPPTIPLTLFPAP